MGFTLRDDWQCEQCDCSIAVGQTVWYCDLCSCDICSCCMGYGEDPYDHVARARSSALDELRTAADLAYRAARDAAVLAPPSLLDDALFRERSLHVSKEWLVRTFPPMDVEVTRAKLTPTRGHVERTVVGKRTFEGDDGPGRHWQKVLYTPAREHESPASQRKRTMRFRRREEQALFRIHKFFWNMENGLEFSE